MATTELETLQEEREFDLELIGNFGRFVSSGSYPVEYFMTSMPMPQADNYLKFARDIQMEDIDFDLLMQRDIDEDRIESEILPYLQQDEMHAATRPLFFPPLLAAIVPVEDEIIRQFYGSRREVHPRENFVGVRWEGHFQIYGRETTGTEGLPLHADRSTPKIKSKQTILALRTADANPAGVMLIVIDGQHRLMALKRLWKEHRAKVRDLVVPVCVMYPPASFTDPDGNDTTPSVPRVFRSLFVDVNSTMKVVGGHFNILLSDKSVGDIACRVFCDKVLSDYGKEELACIEWNTRSAKDSYNVTKRYTSSSIGVIQRGLNENFALDKLVYYLLKITDGSEDLFPEDADPEDYFPKVKWDSFSYAQSNAIKDRISTHLAPLLLRLYFDSAPYRELADAFKTEIVLLKSEAEEGGRRGVAAQAVLQKVLEYKPFSHDEPSFSARLMDFESAVAEKRDSQKLGIARYALFQRALFGVAAKFIRLGLEHGISPEKAFSAFIELVNAIFERDRSVFDAERTYMQYTTFIERRIRTRDDTKSALKDLVLAHLMRSDIRTRLVEVAFPNDQRDAVSEQLADWGFKAAGDFLWRYRIERGKAFRKAYDLDYSLTKEEREGLKLKEIEQRQMEKEVKEGKRDEDSVSRDFDEAVEKYVAEYLVEAKDDLRSALSITGDFLEFDEESELGESEDD